MFSEYLDQLRCNGRRYFTSEQIRYELGLSDDVTKSSLYRLKKIKRSSVQLVDCMLSFRPRIGPTVAFRQKNWFLLSCST